MAEGPALAAAERVLAALGRGVLGEHYDPDVPARILATIEDLASPHERRRLLNALRMLDTRWGAALLTGKRVPVSWLGTVEAEALVQRWQASRLGNLRFLGRAIARLALYSLYAYPGPQWERLRYPGPLGSPPRKKKRLEPLAIEGDEYLRCDVVVVGSGAGGGCCAAGLAARGLDVVVVEKGRYLNEADFTHVEPEATQAMYLYAKSLATADLGVQIIAGSVLGGGTLVNYTTSFRTPDYVLAQWHQISGIDAFVSGELDESLDEVSARLSVNTDSSAAGRRDQLLEEGLKRLGWHVDNMPRAVRGCTQDEQCGYCGFGCRVGAKQSTMLTYLEDASRRGARIVTGADVRRVTISDGRATGIEARVGRHRVVVKARAVVAAAGAIETPALLLRSGLTGEVGRHLHLHPGTAALGVFEDEVRPWEGTTQARYSTEFRHWDGGYGPIFETVPLHPGEWGAAAAWTSAAEHYELMELYPYSSICASLPRDVSEGRVLIAKDGSPRVEYVVGPADRRRQTEALVAGAQVLEAAGAREIRAPHRPDLLYRTGSGGGHDVWATDLRQDGLRGATFYSYHQMGSCRMGNDPARSAVGPENESHEVKDLYVTDGSLFPTASGVNPMLTIYALANRAADKIAARLGHR